MIRSFDFLFSCSLARPRLRPARCKDLKVAWDQRRSGEAPWLLRDRNFVKGPGHCPRVIQPSAFGLGIWSRKQCPSFKTKSLSPRTANQSATVAAALVHNDLRLSAGYAAKTWLPFGTAEALFSRTEVLAEKRIETRPRLLNWSLT
jgi:hypothetical protein